MAKASKQAAPQEDKPLEQAQYPMKYEVRIYGMKDEGSQRASASVNINDAFAVRGVKVMEGVNGLFVSMPAYKSGNEYKDICFPCTKESRAAFDKAVLNAYEQALTQQQAQGQQQGQSQGVPEWEQTMR